MNTMDSMFSLTFSSEVKNQINEKKDKDISGSDFFIELDKSNFKFLTIRSDDL